MIRSEVEIPGISGNFFLLATRCPHPNWSWIMIVALSNESFTEDLSYLQFHFAEGIAIISDAADF